jgi:hypothetical protein
LEHCVHFAYPVVEAIELVARFAARKPLLRQKPVRLLQPLELVICLLRDRRWRSVLGRGGLSVIATRSESRNHTGKQKRSHRMHERLHEWIHSRHLARCASFPRKIYRTKR